MSEARPGVDRLLEAAREIAAALGEYDRLIDAKEVGELLGMSESAVRRLTHDGRIPHVPIPAGTPSRGAGRASAQQRTVRYRRASVLTWVDSLEQGGEVVKVRTRKLRSA